MSEVFVCDIPLFSSSLLAAQKLSRTPASTFIYVHLCIYVSLVSHIGIFYVCVFSYAHGYMFMLLCVYLSNLYIDRRSALAFPFVLFVVCRWRSRLYVSVSLSAA